MNERKIINGFKKYFTILKYGVSAGASAIIDLVMFYIALYVLERFGAAISDKTELTVLVATVFARVVSSLFNYSVNRKVVFASASRNSFVKYYLLCGVQMLASAGLVAFFSTLCMAGKLGKLLIKLVVDTCLFFVSYWIQREWVFKDKKQE